MVVRLKDKGHTFVNDTCNGIVLILHNTNIVIFNNDRILLNTGGFETALTIRRMNQASEEFGLGYHVFRRVGTLYCNYHPVPNKFSKTQQFTDGKLELERRLDK
jgi:hypothetical protein